jgi:hypothetical protein
MEIQYINIVILINMILLSTTVLAATQTVKSAAQLYYLDSHHNLWFKVNMNDSIQHFNVYNTAWLFSQWGCSHVGIR